jgi:transformation/transcription domain-associated protein
MAFNSVDIIVMKHTKENAARVLLAMIETSVEKLESMLLVHQELVDKMERAKNSDREVPDMILIEKARPVSSAAFAVEKTETVFAGELISRIIRRTFNRLRMLEYRMLYRTFVHGFRTCLAGIHKVDAPIPDGNLISRVLEVCIRGAVFFDGAERELNDVLDWITLCFTELSLHIVQEVWTQKMGEYFECVTKRIWLLQIIQQLLPRESISPTLVPIVLEYLIERLPQLGEYDDQTAVASIRLFKMAFSAVTLFPAENEPVLASHLGKLIMDCFPLAAKATKPTNYFHLLRGLFRAIGGGGGKFELLYKEVLPLLPEMLECLNRQLYASTGFTRDLIVELCLTVPLRLTHLLPHLTYLMQPLALALRGGHELVSQGLRTLELCIDNLTPDFLDPTLDTVLRELMEALHDLLKPLPSNHQHAHTTIRILGKLGGRNRKLLDKEPSLDFRQYSNPAKIRISLSGCIEQLELAPVSILALKTLKKSQAPYHLHAYNYLESCLSVLVQDVRCVLTNTSHLC